MLIDIEKIKITNRIRKDLGDIQGLADEIKKHGLINSPVITSNTYELIAGERRIRALQLLGYEQIEVKVMDVRDAEHQFNLEISENEDRKEFTKSERIDYARQLERIESLKARDRQSELNGKSQLSQNSDEAKGRTDEFVAEKLDFGSRDTYRKEKFIFENQSSLTPKEFAEWDEGKLSTNKAYLTIKEKLNESEIKVQEYVNKLKEKENEIATLQSREPETIETIIDNTDYASLEKKTKELERLQKKYDIQEEEIKLLNERAEIFEENSEKYKELKAQIEDLTKEKTSIGEQIKAATSISGMIVDIKQFLATNLSPIKYSRALLEVKDNPVVIKNVSNIVECVQQWCDEMRTYLPNYDKNNVIDMEDDVYGE